jgi:hypothetical protein
MNGTLRLAELSADGQTLTEYDQNGRGAWSSGVSTSAVAYPGSGETGRDVVAAPDYFSGLQVALIDGYKNYAGGVYHTILRDSTNTFDPIAAVGPQIDNYYGAMHVALAQSQGDVQLVFSTSDGNLFHAIRNWQGNWSTAGDVESVAGNATAGPVTLAGFNY